MKSNLGIDGDDVIVSLEFCAFIFTLGALIAIVFILAGGEDWQAVALFALASNTILWYLRERQKRE